MKLLFIYTVISIFPFFFYGQDYKFYFIEDVYKSNNVKKFGSTIMELKDKKVSKIYSFNKRINFPQLTAFDNEIFILLPESNYLYKFNLSKNKIVRQSIIDSEVNSVSFIKSNLQLKKSIYFKVYLSKSSDIMNSINDTALIYSYDILLDKIYLVGNYIRGVFTKKSSNSEGYIVLLERKRSKVGLVGEFINGIDLKTGKVVTIDTLFVGYDESKRKIDVAFNQNNVQFLNDSILIYTCFKYDRENEKGKNIIYSYNYKKNEKNIITSINNQFPFEGFYYDLVNQTIYFSNEEEILSINMLSLNKTTLYKLNKIKSDNIKCFSR